MKSRGEFVTDSVLHFALRELRSNFFNRRAVAILAGVSLIITIMAPFGTEVIASGFLRFCYWLAIVVGTAFTGSIVTDAVYMALQRRVNHWLAIALAAIATAIAVCIVVFAINVAVFGMVPADAGFLPLFSTIFAISLVISATIILIEDKAEQADPKGPAILSRLPLELRGPLYALSAEDHYVNVRTSNGADLLLIRLNDAMKEAEPTEGLQVHRSHWVATSAIKSARREGDRAVLTLLDGTEIPASRKFVPELKAVGILT